MRRRGRGTDASRPGALATAVVLVGGIVSFSKGNPKLSQTFMRLRVAAQAFTLVAIGYGTVNAVTQGGKQQAPRRPSMAATAAVSKP